MYLLYTVQYCRLCCGKKLHLRCSTQYYPLSTVCSIQYLHIQYYTTKGDYQERTFWAINHGFFYNLQHYHNLKKNSHGQHSFISMNVLKNSSAFYRWLKLQWYVRVDARFIMLYCMRSLGGEKTARIKILQHRTVLNLREYCISSLGITADPKSSVTESEPSFLGWREQLHGRKPDPEMISKARSRSRPSKARFRDTDGN